MPTKSAFTRADLRGIKKKYLNATLLMQRATKHCKLAPIATRIPCGRCNTDWGYGALCACCAMHTCSETTPVKAKPLGLRLGIITSRYKR
mmetsp:Transcript_88475/g.275090  ORF Transcript_88475/g.275090 Transcript_88475/m.275090 type:complete len:90 (+) Transcript_88475:267-536(+)